MQTVLAVALGLWSLGSPLPAETPEPPKLMPFPSVQQCERQYNAALKRTQKLQVTLDLYGFSDDDLDPYLFGGGWHGRQTLKQFQEMRNVRQVWWSLWCLVDGKLSDDYRETHKQIVIGVIGVDRYNARAWPWVPD